MHPLPKTRTMKKALVYEAAGANPARDRFDRKDMAIVAVGHPGELLDVAVDLAREGVRLIELCGGVSPRWRPLVAAAAGPGVQVGSVMFGVESLALAARFAEASADGAPPPAAFILLEPDADPDRDRLTKDVLRQRTHFVPVPDEATAARVARTLAADGIGLIELYGGFSSAGAAAVIDAVQGRAPVGISSFALEATLPGDAA